VSNCCECCQLSDITAAVSRRSLLSDAYTTAVANVNKAIDDADSSVNAVNEMPCCDLASLNSQLASLQVLLSCSLYWTFLKLNYFCQHSAKGRWLIGPSTCGLATCLTIHAVD